MRKPFRYWFTGLLYLLSISVYQSSFAFQISLELLAKLPDDITSPLIELVPIKGSENNYLAVQENGQVHQFNIVDKDSPTFKVLDIKSINPAFNSLTALVMHPNFSTREQVGFATFYTAHTEPRDSSRNFPRILDKSLSPEQLPFDLVVNEWQLDNSQTVNIDTKREILRVATPEAGGHIAELAFHPDTKVWDNDFGLLYVMLNQVSAHRELPLYSGSLLRINPKRFGLKNFTVPTDNPFIESPNINNEIVALGLGTVNHFVWPTKDKSNTLITHKKNDANRLSLINEGTDFLSESATPNLSNLHLVKQLLETEYYNANQLIRYQGSAFSYLWGSAIIIEQEGGNLMINSVQANTNEPATSRLWTLSDSQPAMLFNDHQGEILIVKPEEKSINRLINLAIADDGKSSPVVATNNNSVSKVVVISIILLSILAMAFKFSKQLFKTKHSAKNFINKQYTRMELSDSKTQINLYKRHQTLATKHIVIKEIEHIEVCLNGQSLHHIDSTHGFNEAMETDMREQFNLEKRNKIVPGTLRKITLTIRSQSSQDDICLYLRKGDDRITRHNYGNVINEVIDWCWTIATTVTPEHTAKRPVIVEQSPKEKNKDTNKPLFKTTDKAPKQQTTNALNALFKENIAKDVRHQEDIPPTDKEKATGIDAIETSKIDAELVNALDKLAKLNQQSFLTDEEFEQAKSKLLKGLR